MGTMTIDLSNSTTLDLQKLDKRLFKKMKAL